MSSEREDGELDSGEEEEEQSTSTAPPQSTETLVILDDSPNPTMLNKEVNQNEMKKAMDPDDKDKPPSKGSSHYRYSKNSRRHSTNAFNEIVNSNQKFIGRRSNESHLGFPSNRNGSEYRPTAVPSSSGTFGQSFNPPPSRKNESWRPEPIQLDATPADVMVFPPPSILRRPLLPTPIPLSIPVPLRFAPPPFRQASPLSLSPLNHDLSNAGGFFVNSRASITSRVSEDMDISPSNTVCQTPAATDNCVMFVDSPIEDSDMPEPLQADVPNLLFPSLSNATEATPSTAAPISTTKCSHAIQDGESPSNDVSSSSKPKKYSKKDLDRMRQMLLENFDETTDYSSASSSSELEDDIDDFQRLKEKLVYHHEEMQDAITTRNELLKKLDTCQLMMTHHCHAMDKIMATVGNTSRKTLRYAKGSRLKIKGAEKNKRRRIRDKFENRVNSMLRELSKMTESSPTSRPAIPYSTSLKTSEAPLTNEVAETTMDDSVTAQQSPSIQSPIKKKSIDYAFQNDALKKLRESRYGVAKLPTRHRSAKKTPQKEGTNALENADVEKEEALRRKLLEQMKKKHPSEVEGNAQKEKSNNAEREAPNDIERNTEEMPSTDEFVLPIEAFYSNEAVNPPVVVEKIRIVPTIEQIHELKAAIANSRKIKKLTKNKLPAAFHFSNFSHLKPKDISPLESNQSLPENQIAETSSPSNVVAESSMNLTKELQRHVQEKQRSGEAILSPLRISSPNSRVSQTIRRQRVPEKENIAANVSYPFKRSAPPLNEIPSKRKRPLLTDETRILKGNEEKDLGILFNSPRIAVRNFILCPEYPIAESIEHLRHRNDPDVELCYFELFGTCIDDECPYQHERDYRLTDLQILEEVLQYIPERLSRSESITQQAKQLLKTNSINKVIEILRKEAAHLDLIKLAIENATKV